MLYPLRQKYKKNHLICPSLKKKKSKNIIKEWYDFAIISLDNKFVTAKQVESGRRVIVRNFRKSVLKNKKKLIINIFPYVSKTKKPNEVRMGGGKGMHYIWLCPITVGMVIYQLKGINELEAKNMLREVKYKLGLNLKIIKNEKI